MNPPRGAERAWVELDLDAVRRNARTVLRAAGVPLCAVVKADAYGHGATEVARAAREGGATSLAVATPEEALRLRAAGQGGPIQVLGALLEAELEPALEARAELTIQEADDLPRLVHAAARVGRRIAVHLKVDTGMARHGVAPEEALPLLQAIRAAPGLEAVGLMTHLSSAPGDPAVSRAELARFQAVVDAARSAGLLPPRVHAAASAGLFRFPEARHSEVRSGIALLGLDPEGVFGEPAARLRPALSLHARVLRARRLEAGQPAGYGGRWVASRPSTVVLFGLGYADGLPWSAGTRGARALLRGVACPIVGSIMMDYALLDATEVPGPPIAPGEQVTLFGRQGAAALGLEELSRAAGLIPYAVACGLGGRLRREVVGASSLSTTTRMLRRAA